MRFPFSFALSLISAGSLAIWLPGCGDSGTPSTAEPSPTPASIPAPDISATPVPPREAYVAKSFQSESQLGIHDFPKGAKVGVLEVVEGDYVIVKDGVSVRISEDYLTFEAPSSPATTPVVDPSPAAPDSSPSEVAEPVTPSPTETDEPAPAAPDSPSPPTGESDATMESTTSAAVDEITVEEDAPVQPDPAPIEAVDAVEEARVTEITEQIREVNEEIRTQRESGSSSESQLDELRRKRDRLGKELSDTAKP